MSLLELAAAVSELVAGFPDPDECEGDEFSRAADHLQNWLAVAAMPIGKLSVEVTPGMVAKLAGTYEEVRERWIGAPAPVKAADRFHQWSAQLARGQHLLTVTARNRREATETATDQLNRPGRRDMYWQWAEQGYCIEQLPE
jgi:hypothetical protein